MVSLSPKVFATLYLLVTTQGRVVSKQEFMDALWHGSFVEDGNLTQNIFVLRKVLGVSPDARPYIETVPKRGYRFVGVVSELPGNISKIAEKRIESTIPLPLPDWADSALDLYHQSFRRVAFLVPPILLLVFLLSGYLALHSVAPVQIGGYQRLTNDGNSKEPATTHGAIIFGWEPTLLQRAERQRDCPRASSRDWGRNLIRRCSFDQRRGHRLTTRTCRAADRECMDHWRCAAADQQRLYDRRLYSHF